MDRQIHQSRMNGFHQSRTLGQLPGQRERERDRLEDAQITLNWSVDSWCTEQRQRISGEEGGLKKLEGPEVPKSRKESRKTKGMRRLEG